MSSNKELTQEKKIVVSIQDLFISFGDNHVLNGFSLELFEGENLVVMGKSGCGI
jgi:phospholipid/cholesterol/gamma-HCH transport system ATP-binding protein